MCEVNNIGYESEFLDDLIQYEDTHWWFQNRNQMIVDLVAKFGAPMPTIFLEIGCGNGCVTKALAEQFTEMNVIGTEYFETGLKTAIERVPSAEFKQLDATQLDGRKKYGNLGAFDVIEHIADDIGVLTGLAKSMEAHSRLFITVPQHMWLWSVADDYAQHKVRYNFKLLKERLDQAGLEVVYRTSYVALLVPLMFLSRMKQTKLEDYRFENEFRISKWLNQVLGAVCKIERFLRNIGVPLPIGGSLVVVAKLKKTA